MEKWDEIKLTVSAFCSGKLGKSRKAGIGHGANQ
jgi:hypothetical protein